MSILAVYDYQACQWTYPYVQWYGPSVEHLEDGEVVVERSLLLKCGSVVHRKLLKSRTRQQLKAKTYKLMKRLKLSTTKSPCKLLRSTLPIESA